MIYVSSSCLCRQKITDSIHELARAGIYNIELSGGSHYYAEIEQDLLDLKEKYKLNYRCHNYFPPPEKPFVLNLASLDDSVYQKTINHMKSAISLSRNLGAKKFAFHAGFFLDIKLNELGRAIGKAKLFDKKKSEKRFCEGFELLNDFAGDVELYVENNVFSQKNFITYEGEKIFMLTDLDEYFKLKEKINFNLLLDVAHLKVSCHTLGLNFESELNQLVRQTDYLHVSDNNGLEDSNRAIDLDGDLFKLLSACDLTDKDITLEVYGDISEIHSTMANINSLLLTDSVSI